MSTDLQEFEDFPFCGRIYVTETSNATDFDGTLVTIKGTYFSDGNMHTIEVLGTPIPGVTYNATDSRIGDVFVDANGQRYVIRGYDNGDGITYDGTSSSGSTMNFRAENSDSSPFLTGYTIIAGTQCAIFRPSLNFGLTHTHVVSGILSESLQQSLHQRSFEELDRLLLDIGSLGNVNITAPVTSGDTFIFDGTNWVNSSAGSATVATSSPNKGDGTVGDPVTIIDGTTSETQVLFWNGTEWTPSKVNLGDIFDGTATAGDTFVYDGTTFITKPLNLTQLGDVTITGSPTSGDTLTFNGTEWVNSPADVTPPGDSTVVTLSPVTGDGSAETPVTLIDGTTSETQVLFWNGTEWTPSKVNLGDIFDGTATSGDTFVYDGTTFIAQSLNLTQLGDVTITGSPTSGDTLSFNGTEWVNSAASGSTVATLSPITGDGSAETPVTLIDGTASETQVLFWNGTAWTPSKIDIGDIFDGTATAGDTFVYDGTTFITKPLNLTQLGDVTITGSPTSGDTLSFNGTEWVNSAASGSTVATLSPITGDGSAETPVTLIDGTASETQVLFWNGTAWLPSKIQIGDIFDGTATAGDIFIFNGTEWIVSSASQGAFEFQGDAVNFAIRPTGSATNGNINNGTTSTILAGSNNVLGALTNSSILGGSGIDTTALVTVPASTGMSYAPGLWLQHVVVNNDRNQFLMWDGTTGDVEIRELQSLLEYILAQISVNAPLLGTGTVSDPISLTDGGDPADVLRWDGTTWANAALAVPDLADVELTNDILTPNQILLTNGTTGVLSNELLDLNLLADVELLDSSPGDVLFYDGTVNSFTNKPLKVKLLKDVKLQNPAAGEILILNGSEVFNNELLELNLLADVNLTDVINNSLLLFNGSTNVFDNHLLEMDLLADVVLSNPIVNDAILFDGTLFRNNILELSLLQDVDIGSIGNGNILQFNGTSNKLEAVALGLNTLQDVEVGGIGLNDLLQFNGSEFIPITLSDLANALMPFITALLP